MKPIIKDLTVSKEQVIAVLQNWLNTDILCLCPHQIVDIGQYEADEADGRFSLVLEPFPAAVVEDVFDLKRPLIDVVMATTNGTNGAHRNEAPIEIGSGRQEAQAVSAAAAESKRRSGRSSPVTPEQRQRIIELVRDDRKRDYIAAQVGIADSVLYRIIAEARAAGELPERAQHAAA